MCTCHHRNAGVRYGIMITRGGAHRRSDPMPTYGVDTAEVSDPCSVYHDKVFLLLYRSFRVVVMHIIH